jgi:putative copper export protein
MPGTRFARVAMIVVAVLVVAGLILSMVAAPGAAPVP